MPPPPAASGSGNGSAALRVVVGITGGIAAYKAVSVVREFVRAGHDVHVIATDTALRFIGRPTLEALSRNPVHSGLFDGVAEVRHVAIGQSADVLVVAPATANTLAKVAAGIADDLLGNTILASTAPLVIAPAMHTEMWQNPATVRNIEVLRSRGVTVIGPADGQLTGTDSGQGRLAEPEVIVAAALAVATGRRTLLGVRVLVTAGGTREPLDPVRFLGNRSSGRQGVALAAVAAARGAEVCLIAAHLEVPTPAGVRVLPVGSAQQLAAAVATEATHADLILMAAAVADYRPATVSDSKLKKATLGTTFTLELVRNPDILAGLTERAGAPTGQRIVGFAAETEADADALLALGRDKVRQKGVDFLVLNRVGWADGIGSADNSVTVLDATGAVAGSASGSKLSVAAAILDVIGAESAETPNAAPPLAPTTLPQAPTKRVP